MENINEINQKIAKNIMNCRKAAGLTQAELAEKINYSDKSVSKWESGNGVPDVYTLMQMAKLFGVTVNDLIGEEPITMEQPKSVKTSKGMQALIMLLSSGIVWLVAILSFVVLQLVKPDGGDWWIAFIYAVVVNAIVLLVYACIWKRRILNVVTISVIIWVSLTALFLTVRALFVYNGMEYGTLWLVFLLGIPLQCMEIFWESFRSLLRKQRRKGRSQSAKGEEK